MSDDTLQFMTLAIRRTMPRVITSCHRSSRRRSRQDRIATELQLAMPRVRSR